MEGIQKLKIDHGALIAGGLKGTAMGIFKSIANKDNLMTAIETVSSTKDAFLQARGNAKLTGKILGHYLSNAEELQTYSISLIGFSLGTQVIKSCINTIAKIGV
jgi:hypothetical protein